MQPDLGLNVIELDRIYRSIRHRLLDEPAPVLTIGGLTVRRRLGTGASGLVYAAYDPEQDREVALKLVRPTGDDAEAVERTRAAVLQEAQALARLSHPAIVDVYGVGERATGEVYLTMARIDGPTLDRWAAREPRPLPVVMAMLAELAAGLHCAHRAGLCHGDVKPTNIVVDPAPRPYWIDFGLARGVAGPPDQGAGHTEVVGTPGYRAPELEAGGPPTAAADQYAFFMTLLEVLSPRPAARGGLTEERIAALPRSLRTLTRRGLAKDPSARHPDMQAVATALADAPRGARRRKRLVLAAVAGIGLAAAVARPRPATPSPCTRVPEPLALPEGFTVRLETIAPELGPATGAAMREAVTAYDTAWTRARTEVCNPDEDASIVDQRLACLTRSRRELAAIVAALDPEDRAVLTRGRQALREVEPPQRCATQAARRLPPDRDPGLAAALVEARALRALGKYDEARPALQSLLQRLPAERADATLRAEVLLELAMLETQGGTPARTLARLREVVTLAHGAGATTLEAHAWVRLIHVAHNRGHDRKAARAALPDARASVELARDPRLAVWLQIEEGLIANDPGAARPSLVAAITMIEDALGQARALDPPAPALVATALNALAGLHSQAGDAAQSVVLHREALALRLEALGPAHPDVALSHMNLALLAASSGDHPTALAHFDTVLGVAEQVVGLEDPGLCRVYLPRAQSHLALGHIDAAIADLELAATKAEQTGYAAIAEQARGLLTELRTR